MKIRKMSETQCFLTVLFVVCFLISNIVAGKQLLLPFGITMTGAIFVFPITYILSDLFSEVYGYRWSAITRYLGFGANVFMVLIFQLVISTPAPEYWGNQDAFCTVLGNTPRILIASLLGFVIGDFANDKVFAKMKQRHSDMKGFGLRAILSSLVGEAVDSSIFIPIAFFNTMPFETMLWMGVVQVCLKVTYEIVILPITKFCVKKVIELEKGYE